jgi:hypothetical protein
MAYLHQEPLAACAMTEEAKQTVLLLFQDVQRNGNPERELHHFQLIHDKLLHDLSEEVPSDLKSRLLTIPSQLCVLIDEARAKLARTSRIIAYIEQTPAAVLTRLAILHVE